MKQTNYIKEHQLQFWMNLKSEERLNGVFGNKEDFLCKVEEN